MPIIVEPAGTSSGGEMQALNDAAVASLRDIWTAEQVHEVGAVPDKPTTPYVVVSISRGGPRTPRKASSGTSRFYRLAVQCFGRDYSEVASAINKADAAFLDARLPVTGSTVCTPCRNEVASNVIRDPDGGALLGATLTYTFTSAPA